MLKTTLILGLVAPFLFKPRPPVADNDAGFQSVAPELPPMPVLPGLDPSPVATVATVDGTDEIPWPELPQMLTPEEAVRAFLDDMIEFCGGESIRFRRLAWSYDAMRRGRAKSDECEGYAPRPWPPIKDKTLSQLLCALGCVSEKRDMRSKGEGRPTFVSIPVAADVADDEEIQAEPMPLAA
ncbi:hypothetical protein [Hyphomicrobium sp. CS1GBMeth3]|uniref:hypothetical protein n=1 Tax=Hyphomicrobium sp. CS1GBMeth3 TaxID=1892845 RepID=UPI000930C476|nr:hypothetical protein [Hyphomicrobium sp. CS1GBMeth3]